jgi:hypothetical protein
MMKKYKYGDLCFGKYNFISLILLTGLIINISGITNVLYADNIDPYPAPKGPFFKLVEDKSPASVVVLSSNSSSVEQFAAKELVEYIKKITSADVKIVTKSDGKSYPIFIGKSFIKVFGLNDISDLGTDGFILKSTPEGVLIAGNEDLGTLYGVYTFIEKHLGVRWFMPDDIGEVLPNSSTLKVGTFDELEKPSFKVRWIESGDWALKQKMNVAVKADSKRIGVNWWRNTSFHTHILLIPPSVYFDKHPEWYALRNGKRVRPKDRTRSGKQLCTSNPELIKEMAKNVIKIFDKDPSIDILHLSPCDGGGFCSCKKCKALDGNWREDEEWHGRWSNRLATFHNKVAELVAEKYPDKIIMTGAYAHYIRVPRISGYKPVPNLGIQVCHTYSCNNHPIAYPTCRRNREMFTKELMHWSKLTKHLFIYEYYNKGAWGILPYPQIHVIRQDIPSYLKIGAEGFYTQAAGDNWPSCGLNHYIAAKLVWNAELDVDLLLADFYEKFYGNAAEPMGQYYTRLERAFKEADACLSPFGLEWATLAAFHFFTPEVLTDLDNSVTKAEKLAQTDVVRKRISLIRARLDFTRKFMDYMTAIREPFKGIDLKDSRAVNIAHKKAIAIGKPLSDELIKFCEKNGIPVKERLVKAHESRKFLISEDLREFL